MFLKRNKALHISYNIKIIIFNAFIITIIVLINIIIHTRNQIEVKIEDNIKYFQVKPIFENYFHIVTFLSIVVLIICLITSILVLMQYNRKIDRRLQVLVGYFEEVGLSRITPNNPILTEYDLQVIDSWNRSVAEIDYLNELREKYFKNMVHDLKTPIQILKINLRMVKGKNVDDIEYIHALKEELDILEKSVTNYLLIEKISFFEKINLINLNFTDYFNMIAERYKLMDFDINTLVANSDGFIKTDETMFTRISENLIENSIKYGSTNNITIILDHKTIKFINRVDNPNELGNIFEGKRQYSMLGNGLGVEIVKTYIKVLNWQIESWQKDNEFVAIIYMK